MLRSIISDRDRNNVVAFDVGMGGLDMIMNKFVICNGVEGSPEPVLEVKNGFAASKCLERGKEIQRRRRCRVCRMKPRILTFEFIDFTIRLVREITNE